MLVQFFARLQDTNILLGVGPQKMTKMPKKCQNGCCAAFKDSTSVDCGPIWFKQIALAHFFAPVQDNNIFRG